MGFSLGSCLFLLCTHSLVNSSKFIAYNTTFMTLKVILKLSNLYINWLMDNSPLSNLITQNRTSPTYSIPSLWHGSIILQDAISNPCFLPFVYSLVQYMNIFYSLSYQSTYWVLSTSLHINILLQTKCIFQWKYQYILLNCFPASIRDSWQSIVHRETRITF